MKLQIQNLIVSLGEKEILHDISLEILSGKLHVLMGPNGSGKSTCASALMGHPAYTVAETSKIIIDNTDVTGTEADVRARAGLFLAFQNPTPIPGVSVANLLRTTYKTLHPEAATSSVMEFNKTLLSMAEHFAIPRDFLKRSLNDEFSGGEKKKLEMLQAAILKPKYAIFDEIDTGLDVDALKIVAQGIEDMTQAGTGVLVITHYQRILKFAKPDFVHILVNGKIVTSGGPELAEEVEKNGYKKWTGKGASV
jgi:Fe-S cluster assembly ATP-binding protein